MHWPPDLVTMLICPPEFRPYEASYCVVWTLYSAKVSGLGIGRPAARLSPWKLPPPYSSFT